MPSIDRVLRDLASPKPGADPSSPTTLAALDRYWADLADKLEERTINQERAPDEWEPWLRRMFPQTVAYPFGEHHEEFWTWVDAIPPSSISAAARGRGGADRIEVSGNAAEMPKFHRPDPFIAIWPRGGAKTTSGELADVYLGAKEVRRYVVIVSSKQDQANDKVQNVAAKLESPTIQKFYPRLSERAVGKYGSPKGWRRNRLHTASGFIVDALGLDVAARGLKVEDFRPDMIVLDDVDEKGDTEEQSNAKIRTITDTILPIGTMDAAILGLQNLIIPNGIFARLANGTADFLRDAIVSGPVPAIDDLVYELREVKGKPRPLFFITGGTPRWEGQGLEACERAMNAHGDQAFLREMQHEVDESPDALWSMDEMIKPYRVDPGDVPDLVFVATGVDPQGSVKKGHETGIVTGGIDANGHIYVLDDASINARPLEWGEAAINSWADRKGDWIVGESNFGGDMVEDTISVVAKEMGIVAPFRLVRASRGKVLRAEPVVSLYQRGLVHHVGVLSKLEKQQTTWHREAKWSPNRIDALVWMVYALVPELEGRKKGTIEHMWMRW